GLYWSVRVRFPPPAPQFTATGTSGAPAPAPSDQGMEPSPTLNDKPAGHACRSTFSPPAPAEPRARARKILKKRALPVSALKFLEARHLPCDIHSENGNSGREAAFDQFRLSDEA